MTFCKTRVKDVKCYTFLIYIESTQLLFYRLERIVLIIN